MKTYFTLILAFLSILEATAESRLPQIVCRDTRGKPFPLELERFAMEVDIHQDLAETTLTLTFRNNSNRQLEGDFLLPLPPNAHISGYALEVQGEFREAVAVEKERARLAYESIKRRGIDPGIVEKEATNLYRTRIFPIERESSKSVRISYLEYLPVENQYPFHPIYRYPFNLTSNVNEVSIRVHNPDQVTASHPALEFLNTSDNTQEAMLENSTLQGALIIKSRQPHDTQLLLSEGEEVAYLTMSSTSTVGWRGTPEKPIAPVRKKPRKIKILWDASRSRAHTNLTKSFSYLDAFFEKAPNLKASVYLLRNQASKLDDFQITNGNWSALKSALETVQYDGSTNLAEIKRSGQEDLTLLFTDGQITEWPTQMGEFILNDPLIALITDSPKSTNTLLQNLTRRSGGQVISLSDISTKSAITRTFHKSFHLRTPQAGIEILPLPSNPPFVSRYLLKGKNLKNAKIQIAVGPEDSELLKIEKSKAPAQLLKRLSGIATLSYLEEQHAPPSKIIDHCKEHALVSDFTSLIVLERFLDHIQFRIPPPESHLIAEYQNKLKEKKTRISAQFEQEWAEVIRRHRSHYPGVDFLILEDLKRIRIHNASQEQAFKPNQLDTTVKKAFQDWEEEALELIRQQREQKIDTEFKKEISTLREKSIALSKLQAKPKEPMAVSIRGFVREPNTFEFKKNTTLKEAVTKATPLSAYYLSTVAVYRSGLKTVYNLHSKQFKDFPLLPGDMIVVESGYYSYNSEWGGADDPFAESNEEPLDFSSIPAVVSTPQNEERITFSAKDIPQSGRRRAILPFGESGSHKQDASTEISRINPISIAEHALNLFKQGQQKKARLHLSNLRELFANHTAALRLEALVLSYWNESPEKIYRKLLAKDPRDHLTCHLYAEYCLSKGRKEQSERLYKTYFENLENSQDFTPATILRSDQNKLLDNLSGQASLHRLPKDLRIVAINLHPDPSFKLTVTDPSNCVTGSNQISPTGVSLMNGIGIWELTDRKIIQGNYELKASCKRKQLLEIITYQKFGSREEEVSRKLVFTPACETSQLIATIVVE